MSNAFEKKEPNFRLVPKTAVPENPTREDFADYLLAESGGIVMLEENSPVKEHTDPRYWCVPCFSFDGKSGPTQPANAVFSSGCLTEEQIEEQIRLFGNA